MGAILAIIIGILIAWLDIFFMANAPGGLKISFVVLGIVAYLVQGRPALALLLAMSAAVASDLIVPLPWFGGRIIGYAALYWLCRFLIDSFFPINRPGAVWILTFILSLTVKLGALFCQAVVYWWAGEGAASLLSWGNAGRVLMASGATVAVMMIISYLFSKFDLITRRFFLIRR